MTSGNKLTAMARKWKKMAASSRRMTSLPSRKENSIGTPFVTDKGHFVVYTTDGRRFTVPISGLYSDVFRELFKMSEDEFGFSCDGPITVPCDAAVMEYVVSLVRRGLAKDSEKALLNIVASSRCTVTAACLDKMRERHEVPVCGH